ncbi:MAG: acetate/propionate family kinase [Nitrospira sp.]|nr:acetate/propionate family kinase [Nitrospira sp.]MCP9443242.1 acetate/propionate family kinase [Nitrospira sp.]
MNILVLNSGSSSLKFLLVRYPSSEERADEGQSGVERGIPLVRGTIERIGGPATLAMVADGIHKPVGQREVLDHRSAVEWIVESLGSPLVEAVGHRVVHGGAWFRDTVVIDQTVLEKIALVTDLAPLHNRACLATIEAARTVVGAQIPMVAVFDTAFHRTIPDHAATYAIPEEWSMKYGVRRYGFHGIAHASSAAAYAGTLGRSLKGTRLITVHLGSGCSATAIRDGCSIDTSMGFTPMEGLVMGTRAGDCDTGLVGYLARHAELTVEQIDRLLNERSGLLGLSGRWSDMREIVRAREQGDQRAELAIAVFCYRVRKYLGAYLAVLGGADAVLFSGGIGERSPLIRARICEGMDWCGLRLDEQKNSAAVTLPAGSAVCISPNDTTVPAYVTAVDEETWIAREVLRCLQRKEREAQ